MTNVDFYLQCLDCGRIVFRGTGEKTSAPNASLVKMSVPTLMKCPDCTNSICQAVLVNKELDEENK